MTQTRYITLWGWEPDVTASWQIKKRCLDATVGRFEALYKEHTAWSEEGYTSIVWPLLPALISYATRGLIWDPLRESRENRSVSVKWETNLFVMLPYTEF